MVVVIICRYYRQPAIDHDYSSGICEARDMAWFIARLSIISGEVRPPKNEARRIYRPFERNMAIVAAHFIAHTLTALFLKYNAYIIFRDLVIGSRRESISINKYQHASNDEYEGQYEISKPFSSQ